MPFRTLNYGNCGILLIMGSRSSSDSSGGSRSSSSSTGSSCSTSSTSWAGGRRSRIAATAAVVVQTTGYKCAHSSLRSAPLPKLPPVFVRKRRSGTLMLVKFRPKFRLQLARRSLVSTAVHVCSCYRYCYSVHWLSSYSCLVVEMAAADQQQIH